MDLDPNVPQEIQTMVAEAVARFGVAGDVRVEGDRVVLTGHGPEAHYPLGALPRQWDTLPIDLRQRKAMELARGLTAQRRASLPAERSAPASSGSVLSFVVPVALLVGVAGIIYGTYRVLGPSDANGDRVERAPASASAAVIDDREARAKRVCDATRSRVMRGATVGPTDVEGWVVELVLLRSGPGPNLVFDPAFGAFVDRGPGKTTGKLVWPVAKDVVAADGPETHVEVTDGSVPGEAAAAWRGVRLTFRGRYVVPYFRNEHRIQFVRLANALGDRLGASFGALYARCDQGRSHHLGSWFLGDGPGDATASLIYFLGTHADVPHVRQSVLSADGSAQIDRAHAFRRILAAATPLERDRVMRLLGPHGGGLTGKGGGRTTITFPFRDGNRAARASRDIALQLQIGVDR